MEPLSRRIQAGLAALELPSDAAAVQRWARLATLLERWNRQINLSGHRGAEQIAQRLLLEAAAFCRALPAAESIADLGSGAGIPGLPIALARPETHVVLIESRQRRHHFQLAAVRELALTNAEPVLGRSEELEPRRCGGVVAQALKSPSQAIELMRPWVRPGGWIALATTPDARLPGVEAGVEAAELRTYAAPGEGPERAAWIARLREPEA